MPKFRWIFYVILSKSVATLDMSVFKCTGGIGGFMLSVFHKLETSKKTQWLQKLPLLKKSEVRAMNTQSTVVYSFYVNQMNIHVRWNMYMYVILE